MSVDSVDAASAASIGSFAGAKLPFLRSRRVARARVGRRLLARPELLAVMAVAAVLNLWGLAVNGWANTYYSAAVRSMSASWHNFFFAAMDPSGLMTVDKPPLALWVQALSARVFGLHPLSVLVPQALMGVAATALLYDLVRRRYGRAAGFAGALVLATTPVIVAVSRHNNPDELLVLCSVAAVWAALRALEAGSARWLAWSAVCVGLGFETKMAVALMVVPGIALAWLWCAPLSLRARLVRLTGAGALGALVAGAWPLLVTLTPAADRPWISGTSDNSVWSLIFGYNGLGRVSGQSGGPAAGGPPGGGGGGFGSTVFGGSTGPLRLLQTGLGDQAGWLLGFALVAAVALLIASRLRRRDPDTGWLLIVGGALAASAVVFSFAAGIFHPYYVSFLAPWAAALVGAGTGLMLPRAAGESSRRLSPRLLAPLLLAGGAVTELVVLGGLSGALSWARGLVIVVGLVAVALAFALPARTRAALVAVALAALLAAPATWAAETLGHAESATFPAGGSASAAAGGPGMGFGGRRRFAGGPPGGAGTAGAGGAGAAGAGGAGPAGAVGQLFGPSGGAGIPGPALPTVGPGRGPGAGGGPGFGGQSQSLRPAITYARSHGGGTIGVESQSEAADAIVSSRADVAGLGGFSGRESTVSVTWLAAELAAGHLRWILADSAQQPRLGGDTRSGSSRAFAAVRQACRAVTLSSRGSSTGTGGGSAASATATLYDCQGRSGALLRASM